MQNVPPVGYTLLDRYYVESIIDDIGDTAILKVLDTRLDVYGAVKFLLGDDTSPNWETKRQNFIRSFRAMARLNHPNIVHVANIETRCGVTFSVMELLQGMTLQEFIDSGSALDPKEALEVFLGVIDAVVMAHSCDTLHKRISPSQIFLNHQGTRLSPRILNFSSFKDASELDTVSALPFLAPEQLQDFECAVPASDVFGICASMYYVFTHEPPLILGSLEEYRAFYAQCPGIDVFPDAIPGEFVPILAEGLKTNPDERTMTAAMIVRELKKIGTQFDLSANLSLDAFKNGRTSTPSQPYLPPMRSSKPSMPMVEPVREPSVEPVVRRPSTSVSQSIVVSHTGSHSAVSSHTGSYPPPVSHTGSHSVLRHATQSVSHSIVRAAESDGESIKAVPHDSEASPVSKQTSATTMGAEAVVESIQGFALPPDMSSVYRLRRVDFSTDHSFIGAVSTHENMDVLYAVKCFYANDDVEKAVFNEGVRRCDILSQESPYFQKILQACPESSAFLMSDMMRQSLPDNIRQSGVYTPDVVVQIAILLSSAMEIAHQHGYVNGNLKPSNLIFENRQGVMTPVIYDFGQSLHISHLVGVPFKDIPYIAPELDYNLQKTNAQADIFAFGMCLVYMLIGRSPYTSNDIESLIHEIDSCESIPNLLAFRPDIPKELLQIIAWCTNFDPEKRYLYFRDIQRDLRIVYQGLMSQHPV